MSKRVIAFALIFFFVLSSVAFALTEWEKKFLDELRFIELQVIGVTIDMKLPFMWLPSHKERARDEFGRGIKRLKKIGENLEKLDCPDAMTGIREDYARLIVELENIYNGAADKDPAVITKQFEEFNENYAAYSKKYIKYTEKDREALFIVDLSSANEELKLVQDKVDRISYREALKLVAGKKYEDAFPILNGLETKYKGTAFGDCVYLQLSDCLAMAKNVAAAEEKLYSPEEALRKVSDIINSGRYSPVLYEAFFKWRTLYQEQNHGISNTSRIPNGEYNRKRWKVIKTIKNYLGDHPNDVWAEAQVYALLDLPNIDRSGPVGNSNLVYMYRLYYNGEKPVVFTTK